MSFAFTELCMTENVSNLLTVLITERYFKKVPIRTSTGNFQRELLKVIKSVREVAVIGMSQYNKCIVTFKYL
jgi:hypothetical protein